MAAPLRAEPVRVGAPAVPARPRPRPARRAETARPSIVGGAVWIGVLAVLLAGLVAVNVAVLQLNVELDRLGQERANLRAEKAHLAAKLSRAAAPPRVEALARSRLGLVPATPEQWTYVDLPTRPR